MARRPASSVAGGSVRGDDRGQLRSRTCPVKGASSAGGASSRPMRGGVTSSAPQGELDGTPLPDAHRALRVAAAPTPWKQQDRRSRPMAVPAVGRLLEHGMVRAHREKEGSPDSGSGRAASRQGHVGDARSARRAGRTSCPSRPLLIEASGRQAARQQQGDAQTCRPAARDRECRGHPVGTSGRDPRGVPCSRARRRARCACRRRTSPGDEPSGEARDLSCLPGCGRSRAGIADRPADGVAQSQRGLG